MKHNVKKTIFEIKNYFLMKSPNICQKSVFEDTLENKQMY